MKTEELLSNYTNSWFSRTSEFIMIFWIVLLSVLHMPELKEMVSPMPLFIISITPVIICVDLILKKISYAYLKIKEVKIK